jgi:L-rhamnose isomerase
LSGVDSRIDSLDKIYSQKHDESHCIDSVESKLFGIGAESYTTGSHEFYYGYACKNNVYVCLDMGHFHPTESVADKISAMLPFLPGIALHISRGVRWDSDHVPLLRDPLYEIAQQITRIKGGETIRMGLDFFDASINRTAAWALGYRAVSKALLFALVSPFSMEKESHEKGDYTRYILLREGAKSLPFHDMWNYYCHSAGIPDDNQLFREIERYEKQVLRQRG